MNRIPLVDLAAQHAAVAEEVEAGWKQVIADTAFVGGPQVAEFEAEFARFCQARSCVGVANGTDAIEIALRALGVGPGDECILPVNTFIATAEAVCRAGARPVFVDCAGDGSYLIDVDAAAAAVTSRTRAIIAVHLYGQTAAVERLRPLAERAGAWIVEDAAQAHGALRHGVPAGSLGHIAATSFYPGKNLGAYGDAGAVLTGDDELAARVRLIRDHGTERKYQHLICGVNSRLDSLQAVVLSAKLRRLAGWNAARQRAARRYHALLGGLDGVVPPSTLAGNSHVWHLYVVRVPGRDDVLAALREAGIDAGIHYPVPLHRSPAFASLGHRDGEFPNAERAAGELLSLPIYAELTAGQQDRVITALTAALSRGKPASPARRQVDSGQEAT